MRAHAVVEAEQPEVHVAVGVIQHGQRRVAKKVHDDRAHVQARRARDDV